ncbi:MAG: deoxyribonuclease IV [Deltaproteobacteria bacterium]|nr:deoxyribonuclease IV [Deltaproteobacteria bacterium]
MTRQILGAHMSIAGGIDKAIGRGVKVGCDAIQIFTKNASQWRAKPLGDEEIARFRSAWAASAIGPVAAHDSYLINLASPDPAVRRRSIEAFGDELRRCALLKVPDLVMHPGAPLESGEDNGIARVADAFRELLETAPDGVRILVENTAGQGSCLGHRFEQLAPILAGLPEERFGVCFDTCHAFAAGYDLSTPEGYREVMAEFDDRIGLNRIALFHLNDCKKGCGCRVDRHEHIGSGAIGREGFQSLLRDERFLTIPKILETPKGDDDGMDARNLALLRELAGEV